MVDDDPVRLRLGIGNRYAIAIGPFRSCRRIADPKAKSPHDHIVGADIEMGPPDADSIAGGRLAGDSDKGLALDVLDHRVIGAGVRLVHG